MTEHQKSELLFNFKKFGAIEITGVDKKTMSRIEIVIGSAKTTII